MPQCSAALESGILHLASLRPGALAHILTNDNRKAAVPSTSPKNPSHQGVPCKAPSATSSSSLFSESFLRTSHASPQANLVDHHQQHAHPFPRFFLLPRSRCDPSWAGACPAVLVHFCQREDGLGRVGVCHQCLNSTVSDRRRAATRVWC